MMRAASFGRVLGLLLFIIGIPVPGQDVLTLNARLFDHNYGDFGGEFADAGVKGCSPKVNSLTHGMVRDTLFLDSATGRKWPRLGKVDMCSSELEKWFDPGNSRTTSCGNIFLANSGTPTQPVWKFLDTAFFMMDAAGLQPTWTNAFGSTLRHDYAYCMEVNAAFTYHGGETMKFRGDDDLWVYLDNRIAVDNGGVHNALETSTALDSLSFLHGKLGQTLDMDIYFCSRQPATSVFGMETNVELKPLQVRNIQIVDSTGAAVSGKDVVIGPKRVCARPNYQMPGDLQCSNYNIPAGVSFMSANWDMNGQTLSRDGGQACLDLNPADFPDNTRLNLTAKTGGRVARISLTLARVGKISSAWLRGNGRAEWVDLILDSASGPVQQGLDIRWQMDGKPEMVMALPAATRGHLSGLLDSSDMGPRGETRMAPIPAIASEVLYGQKIFSDITLLDGISPIVTAAQFHWGQANGGIGYNGYPAYIDLTVSEGIFSAGQVSGLFRLKRPGNSPEDLTSQGALLLAQSDAKYRLLLPQTLADRVGPRDSVSLSEAAVDSSGNRAVPYYVALQYPVDNNIAVGPVQFLDNPTVGQGFTPGSTPSALIPVSPRLDPILGGESDRALAASRGPVLSITTRVPLESVQLRFFDHHGGFVNSVNRTFSDDDWSRIAAVSPGDTARLLLMWYPVSIAGSRLGTGVYIVQGELRTRGGAIVSGAAAGAGTESVRSTGAVFHLVPMRFGYIRD